MNKSLRLCLFLAFSLPISIVSFAQNFTGTYTFANVTATSGPTDPTPVPVATGITFGSFHVVGANRSTSSNPNSGGRFNFTGWPVSTAINLGEYFEVIITPQTNYLLTLGSLTFTVQRSGTGVKQFAVRSSADHFASNLPASFSGSLLTVDADNTFKLVNSTTTAAIPNCVININNVTNSAIADTLRFYGWDAGATAGTFSLNRVDVTGAASAVAGTGILTLDTNVLRFPSTYVNTSSPALQYKIKGVSLTNPVTITASGSYTVSDAISGSYNSSLVLAAADVITPKTVFVKFTPPSVGTLSGTITNSSNGAASLNVALTGQGTDPANLSFNFNSCTPLGLPGGGFISYSVTGAQTWACSQYGNSNSNGVDINGYAAGAALDNEDWLISPPLTVASLSAPVLSFYSRGEFTGPSLQLLVSTEYDGYSNPTAATWTNMQAVFPPLTNKSILTDGINFSGYKTASRLYLAFRYTSTPDLGAARWTLDDVNITDRSKLLAPSATALNFGEVASGSSSASQAITLQGFGYGDITATAPAGYRLSTDNNFFTPSVLLSEAAVQTGTPLYIRFSPTEAALKIEGNIRFSATGLDSAAVLVTGSSFLKSRTLDVGAYNLSFFGAQIPGSTTSRNVTTQISNIDSVLKRINLDIIGVEEVSNDSAMAVLVSKLPGYSFTLSNRWSYSFNGPDPTFPAQKVGFIYNTSTSKLVEQRVMFEGLFDSLRNNQASLPGYPDSISHFWSSGRLPYMATFDVTIEGVTKRIRVIDIHAKSSSDVTSYNRRVYDVKVLKDSLDTYYRNDNVILVGDYNDRVYGSIYTGGVSPYRIFVTDTANYAAPDYPLDSAGRVSFITGTGLIDHIIISNELKKNSIPGSTDIEDARTYISGYNATTASDHLPIYTRMNLSDQSPLPVKLSAFNAKAVGGTVVINWKTDQEGDNWYFTVERSADGRSFSAYSTVPGAGTSTTIHHYISVDSFPLAGTSYYRLRQVDRGGKLTFSAVVAVKFKGENFNFALYPNPVTSKLQLKGGTPAEVYVARISSTGGKALLQANGTVNQINQSFNQQIARLRPGMYIITVQSKETQFSFKFTKL